MENVTASGKTAIDYEFYVRYAFSSLEGVLMVFCNGLILASVIRFKALREKKEVVVLCLLVMADFLYGIPTTQGYTLMIYRWADD